MATMTKVKRSNGRKTNLMGASNQWASRPADERFWNLGEMQEALHGVRVESQEYDLPLDRVQLTVFENSNSQPDIALSGDNGLIQFNHWSFNKFCERVGAPAAPLRKRSPGLIKNFLDECLDERRAENDKPLQMLVRNQADGTVIARSVNTGLTRVWNEDKVRMLQKLEGCGWMVPPARPAPGIDDPRRRPATKDDIIPGQDNFALSIKVGDMIAPAGLYAGDRNMFAFMVNPHRIIDDGGQGLMRGFYFSNSEVGDGCLEITAFYLENVCGNHICWGASGILSFKQAHRGKSILEADYGLIQKLKGYANESDIRERQLVARAKATVIHASGKKEEVVTELMDCARKTGHGLSQKVLEDGFDLAVKHEDTAGSNPNTVWAMLHGLTRLSQSKWNADERNDIDTGAGKLLKLAK